ncbi:SIR2 family protein [Undibacterium sp. FT147W]|uniref:SIR2 family protein n=1 Tax=Undibacterium rivi TaxID=2828729 RepID=A0ABS5H4A4_9BURK|nr:SIR2 family protein [Undibacterium rivi]MBR7793347.1 SIR2 family protein [Undibacterium rivi]
MPLDYNQYIAEVTADIETVLTEALCQPILFIGSGFSKRYAKKPNWDELLRKLAELCPTIDKDYAYYKQKYNDPIKIGSVFAEAYVEWAWGAGKEHFPEEYRSGKFPKDIFLKHMISVLLREESGEPLSAELKAEISAIKNISPHAIITTNYDEIIESIFPTYDRIIGQQILRKPFFSIGEIFKIHGCISDPQSIVIGAEDYINFEEDHKYLSAKLLTYFVEHPLIFIGYGANDPNIKKVLYDVDRMVRANFQLIPNIYILEWDRGITASSYPARDKVLTISEDKNIRIKNITAQNFEWVFKAFKGDGNLEHVNLKLLRSLMARSVNLIRSDVPHKNVEIDFASLEHSLENGENFAKLFGVTHLDDPSKVNLSYPYTLSSVAEQLGFNYWSKAQDLIQIVTETKGFNIKSNDNKYHVALKTGRATDSFTHKYSQATVDLLKKVVDGTDYEIDK